MFLVERMSELFENHKRVGIDSRMLSFAYHVPEYLVYVCHIEISAQQKVARPPVVAPQERMHIRHSAASRGAVAQMSHIQFPDIWDFFVSCAAIAEGCVYLVVDFLENFLYGTGAERAFTVDVFVPGFGIQFHAAYSGGFLSAVVLLFHHQVQLA